MKRLALAVSLVALPVAATFAQQATFSSRAFVVRVDVLATEKGIPVSGLTAADFELLDNDVPQSIDVVDTQEVPVNAVLALDTSASTAGKRLQELIGAADALLDDLRPAEPAAITTFSHMVAPRVPLTTDRGAVRDVLRLVEPNGNTAAMDGAYVAMMSAEAVDGRPLVVVFTDGVDTASWLRPADLLDAAKRASAVVYAVATGDARRWPLLKDLSDATGGRMISLESTRDLRGEFRKILTEFRSRYLLAFTPRGVSEKGFHRLTVRSKRRGVEIKARAGYSNF
jgi:Ca-activated chloride channel homolog